MSEADSQKLQVEKVRDKDSSAILGVASVASKPTSATAEGARHLQEIKALGTLKFGPLRNIIFPLSELKRLESSSEYEGWSLRIVHYIRHGQAKHNEAASKLAFPCGCRSKPPGPCVYKDPALLDPVLTSLGEEQAAVHQKFLANARVDIVAVSPLMRTLQTATIAMKQKCAITPDVQFIAVEELREQQGVHVGDKRQPLAKTAPQFPHVDFSNISSDDDHWSDSIREHKKDVAERAYRAMEWLHQRQEKHIVVVSHSSYLLTLFNTALETEHPGFQTWFETGELRSVVQLSRVVSEETTKL